MWRDNEATELPEREIAVKDTENDIPLKISGTVKIKNRNGHTCDKFQKGSREIFLPFQGGLSKIRAAAMHCDMQILGYSH